MSDDAELARAIARAGEPGQDQRQLRQLGELAARSARQAGVKAVTSGRWLADIGIEVAGHVNVRDLDTLRAHHHGLAGSLLAGTLIRNAAMTSAAVGAATGAIAAASEVTPAAVGTLPVALAAETLVVVAIEMKLVAELHEAAGAPLPLSLRMKGPLVARSWAESRGITRDDMLAMVTAAGGGVTAPLTGAAAGLLGRSARDQLTEQLRRRIIRRTGKNIASLAPMLLGAAAGAAINRRATRHLGTRVATSLGIPPPK